MQELFPAAGYPLFSSGTYATDSTARIARLG
jgi:hypothetical protein